jgi:hypothetical protein
MDALYATFCSFASRKRNPEDIAQLVECVGGQIRSILCQARIDHMKYPRFSHHRRSAFAVPTPPRHLHSIVSQSSSSFSLSLALLTE